ncbi:MAG: T9SS type A sorting domain-containing protein [Bacteroidetes bacterium]|nr:T9SS type A sorting domain-containing protein [Bacteroidota bacterium]
MKIIITSLLFLMSTILVNAQKEDYIWYFGNQSGIDFNGSTPVTLTNSIMNAGEGCASISDSAGNILFYTDGITVYDHSHSIMSNGTGLTGNSSSTQSAIIVKKPGASTIYYIFSLDMVYAYSEVDMSLNGGFGAITSNKNIILNGVAQSEKQAATFHSNGTDVWVVMFDVNTFNAYLVSSSGVNTTPVITTIGQVHQYDLGQMCFSKSGNKIALGNYETSGLPNISIYNFNKNTGIVTNDIHFDNGVSQCYGVSFSPDETKLYAAVNPSIYTIYQYDITSNNAATIKASEFLIGGPGLFEIGTMQLGPDGRIYCTQYNSDFLGVIENPDSSGLASGFTPSGIDLLTGICNLGLPNLIAGRQNESTGVNETNSSLQISWYPNPVIDFIEVSIPEIPKNTTIQVCDLTSRIVYDQEIQAQSTKIPMQTLSSGMYILQINTPKNKYSFKLLKQ